MLKPSLASISLERRCGRPYKTVKSEDCAKSWAVWDNARAFLHSENSINWWIPKTTTPMNPPTIWNVVRPLEERVDMRYLGKK